MSLFVVAFFVQWLPISLYEIWQVIDDVSQLLFSFVTTFSNVGGILNGIVFIIILKRKTENPEFGNKSLDEVDISQPRTSTSRDISEACKA
jgi:hypothetical protein